MLPVLTDIVGHRIAYGLLQLPRFLINIFMGREKSSKLLPAEHLLPLTSMTEDVWYAQSNQIKWCMYINLNHNCAASIAAPQVQQFFCCLVMGSTFSNRKLVSIFQEIQRDPNKYLVNLKLVKQRSCPRIYSTNKTNCQDNLGIK